jgi:fructose-specific component phosphotransferase system IIB-like protein
MKRRCLVRFAVSVIALAITAAHADSKPSKLPKVAAAMQKAQYVFLLERDVNGTAKPQVPSADFVQFFQGLQALKRYQIVTDARDADLILTYWSARAARTIDVEDASTCVAYGSYWNSAGERMTAENALLKQTVVLIGSSKAIKPPQDISVPPVPPVGILPPDQSRAMLQSYKTVYIVDGGIPPKYPVPKGSPYLPGQMRSMFAQELTALSPYRIVDNAKDADLELKIGGSLESYVERDEAKTVYQNGIPSTVWTADMGYTWEMQVDAFDTKTQDHLGSWNEVAFNRDGKGDTRDPKAVNVHDVTTMFLTFVSGSESKTSTASAKAK